MVHIFGSSGCNAAGSQFEEVGPEPVFEAAFDGEQGIGARLRPAPSGPLESAADDLLAGSFHDAGPDRQSELPAAVAAHSVRVGLVGANAGGDGFRAAMTRATCPAFGCSLIQPIHSFCSPLSGAGSGAASMIPSRI